MYQTKNEWINRRESSMNYWDPIFLNLKNGQRVSSEVEIHCLFGFLHSLGKEWKDNGLDFHRERAEETAMELSEIRGRLYPRTDKDKFGRIITGPKYDSNYLVGLGANIMDTHFNNSIYPEP